MDASAEATGRVTESTALRHLPEGGGAPRPRRRGRSPGHAPVEEQERCHLLEAGAPIRAT